MNILITGIEGYVGSVLYFVLQQRGYTVHGIDTGYYKDSLLYPLPAPQQVTHIDIRNLTPEHFKGYDAVIHLADLSNDPLGMLNEDVTRTINFTGALNAAQIAKKAGVKRYIYSSSCSVYGISESELSTETSATNPQTMYAQCKHDVEREIKKIANDTFTPVYFRNATVYGLSPRMRFDLVVNKMTADAYIYKKIVVENEGKQWRPLVHVLDLCQAYVCALEAPKETIYNEIFNVGPQAGSYSIAHIAQMIQEEFPDAKIITQKSNNDTRNYKVSFDKIHTQLPGFTTKYDIRDGIQQIHRMLQEISFDRETYMSGKFVRVKMMQVLLEKKSISTDFNWNLTI